MDGRMDGCLIRTGLATPENTQQDGGGLGVLSVSSIDCRDVNRIASPPKKGTRLNSFNRTDPKNIFFFFFWGGGVIFQPEDDWKCRLWIETNCGLVTATRFDYKGNLFLRIVCLIIQLFHENLMGEFHAPVKVTLPHLNKKKSFYLFRFISVYLSFYRAPIFRRHRTFFFCCCLSSFFKIENERARPLPSLSLSNSASFFSPPNIKRMTLFFLTQYFCIQQPLSLSLCCVSMCKYKYIKMVAWWIMWLLTGRGGWSVTRAAWHT